jgi:dsDNA-binding SOS-regulon protein
MTIKILLSNNSYGICCDEKDSFNQHKNIDAYDQMCGEYEETFIGEYD